MFSTLHNCRWSPFWFDFPLDFLVDDWGFGSFRHFGGIFVRPWKTVTEARSSFNLCFVALNEIPFWYPQQGLVVQHWVPIWILGSWTPLLDKTRPHIGYTIKFSVFEDSILFVCFVNKKHKPPLNLLLLLASSHTFACMVTRLRIRKWLSKGSPTHRAFCWNQKNLK